MPDKTVAVIGELTRDQLELVKRTVATGATDDELRLFIHDCSRRGVHPLDRLIHFTKRKDKKTGAFKYTPITSIDFMRSRAAETGEYAGNDDPTFKYGNPDAKHPTEATATVWRMVSAQRCAFAATARWIEYVPGEGLDFMWKQMPHVMLGKVAEALALRKGFPQQLSGLYEGAEMDQAGREERPPDGERMRAPTSAQVEEARAEMMQAVRKAAGTKIGDELHARLIEVGSRVKTTDPARYAAFVEWLEHEFGGWQKFADSGGPRVGEALGILGDATQPA